MDWAANGSASIPRSLSRVHGCGNEVSCYLGERPLLHTDKPTVVIRIDATPCERSLTVPLHDEHVIHSDHPLHLTGRPTREHTLER
jgi:hypothetical protein